MPDIPLHVTQMEGFIQPPVDPPALTVFNMAAAAAAEAADQTPVSSDAAPAEQEK